MNYFSKCLLKFVFPKFCCLCGYTSESDTEICSLCYSTLPWINDRCYRCGLRLKNPNEAIYCERCQTKSPCFDRTCALFNYEPPINKMLTRLKFGKQLGIGRILAEILLKEAKATWYKNNTFPEAIIPVPLHYKRLRKRGYNQALELVWPLKNKYSPVPILLKECTRVRNTLPQSGLNAEKRYLNLKGAFEVKFQEPPPLHIAIVDDVITTGNTVNDLSLALKKTGVHQVDVWCIARV